MTAQVTISSLLSIFCLTLAVTGCEREIPDKTPPLRPLVYTEAPPNSEDMVDAADLPPFWVAPEDLGIAVFQALVEHDRERYEHTFVTGPELTELIRTPEEKAATQSAKLIEDSELVWSLFLPSEPSEEPVGGLTARLKLVEFRVGKGRDLAGKLAKPGAGDVVQHWGSDLRLAVRNSDKVFTLRVPKIVKTNHGWKTAAPLEMDPTMQMYLESGMHLKPELLTSEHYAYPLEVGNYWKYKIKGARPKVFTTPPPVEEPTEESPDNTPPPTEPGAISPNEMTAPTPSEIDELSDPTVRVSVIEVLKREGYVIATLERQYNDHQRTTERFSYLVTPRRVFPCTRDCRENIDEIGYLLGYMSQQIPVFVFPLKPGEGWGKGGRSEDNNPYQIKPELERADVPAGDYTDSHVISGSIGEGLEQRYFVPGTGVVMRKVRSGVGPWVEELIDSRLML